MSAFTDVLNRNPLFGDSVAALDRHLAECGRLAGDLRKTRSIAEFDLAARRVIAALSVARMEAICARAQASLLLKEGGADAGTDY